MSSLQCRCFSFVLALLGLFAAEARSQQVVQRGPLGIPAQVLDETGQWTTPLPVAADAGEGLYIADVSSTPWLQRNYPDFANRGVYVVSMYTHYKKASSCRADLVRWGFGDSAHLDACAEIGYRVRQLSVDTLGKTVSLLSAAMVGQDGNVLETDAAGSTSTRRWTDLDPTALEALTKTNELVAAQIRQYERRLNNGH